MHVWAKGDKCLAPYSEDGENDDYFEARIEKIIKLPGTSRTVAVVTFIGYEDDGQEAFDISKLKKLQNERSKNLNDDEDTSLPEIQSSQHVQLFSQGQEKQRICLLYDDSDEEESAGNSRIHKFVFESSRPKSKNATATSDSNSTQATCDTSSPDRKPKKRTDIDREVSPAGSEFSGFTDDDLERPKFSHVQGGEKVPLVLSAPGVTPVLQVPATINQYLRDYQREGIKFLYKHFSKGRGAILADDMGLGKTVQVIGFIAALLGRTGTKADVIKQIPKFIRRLSDPDISLEEEKNRKVFLIIGPASVLYNWVDEFETWGYFTVGKFHQSHKNETVADLQKNKLDVVVTTYETCRDNLDIINEFQWTAVIADEAHKIKGNKAEITVALKRLKCKRRYGLSGTVLQNDMKELWCVLDWANPKCLGTLTEFEAKFDRVISHGQKRDASKRELAMARKAKDEFGKLRAQWMLRRTKALIADQLPTKDQKVVYCQPTSFQVSVYKAILGHKLMKAVLTQNRPCQCNSGRSRAKCCARIVVDDAGREYPIKSVTMTFMHLLIKVSNHVALLLPSNTHSEEQQIRAREICDVAFSEHPQFLQQTRTASFRTLSDPKYCGKMKVLCGLLSVFKKERSKVLIFSLSTRLLDILEQYIISKGYEYRRLDGKTPNVRRTQLVREFNKDHNIFLFIASTKAGGIGLNLTGANVVVIFDPNWNPSHDLQAEDRAYRIGQGKDVRVLRLISSGTIEEIVYLRQIYKQQLDKVVVADENARRLFHGVQGDSSNTGELFGISNLFKLREGDSTLTADILKRNEQTEAGLKGFNVISYIPPENDSENNQEISDEKKEEPKQLKNGGESTDDMYGADALLTAIFDSDEESDNKPSPKKKKRDMLDSLSEDESESPQPSTSTRINTAKRRKRQLPKSMRASLDNGDDKNDDNPASKRGRQSLKNNEMPASKRGGQSPVGQDVGASGLQSYDSLSEVFENCGVVHTHDNRKIVGRSSAEDYMSRCAIQEVYELHQNTQEPAIHCEALSSSDESDDFGSVLEPVKRKPEKSQAKAVEAESSRDAQEKHKPTKKSSEKKSQSRVKSSGKHSTFSSCVRSPVKSPVKRATIAKGCQFSSLSSDSDDEDANAVDEDDVEHGNKGAKKKESKSKMTDLKQKKQTDTSVVAEKHSGRSKSQLPEGQPSPVEDDDKVFNTQSIIDNLLGMNDSSPNKRPKRKSKPFQQKTVATSKPREKLEKKESQDSSGSGAMKDTMALLDELFD